MESKDRTYQLKGIVEKINGKKEATTNEKVTAEQGQSSPVVSHSESSVLGTGAGSNTGSMIGSSVVSMHVDIPGIVMLSDKIQILTENVNSIKKFYKSLKTITTNFKKLTGSESEKKSVASIIEAARKARANS